jgi:murein DD-endopeptidase MepM/ murein hydrolase activator NlpD
MGGAEGFVDVVAATDGLVVSIGTERLPGYDGTPVAPRYDVVYLLDDRGWFYRYSHLKSIATNVKLGQRLKMGDAIGILGKEGGSGGWSHLHFDLSGRQPS